jgi:hypothetical protein
MSVIINEMEVIAPPPAPGRVRNTPPEQRPKPGPTLDDLTRALRRDALRRSRLVAR